MDKCEIPAASAPTADAAAMAASLAWTASSDRIADYVALTKPRLNLLVVATAFAGFYLGTEGAVSSWVLFHTIVGTALVAAAAAAFNQVYERQTDALMHRTRHRPVPDGRLKPASALAFAWALAVVGVTDLAVGANPLAAAVALVTLVCYTLVYTPLKRHTPLATLVGGVPGGLPPVIGWAAARNALSVEAAVLFAIVFLWQMPHFLAIAWMCRDDYRRAGIPMLPVVEPDGRSTAVQIVLYGSVLIPVSLAPSLVGIAGLTYAAVALALGVGFLLCAVGFARTRDQWTARRLFLGSVIYLPLLWAAMLLNHG